MKKIGILGGLAWPSTVEYYTELCRRGEELHRAGGLPGDPSTPEMTIESLDLNKAASYIGTDDDEASWSQFDEYHREGLRRLEASSVDFALMACNTAHHRFESIVRDIRIPVLNIFEVVVEEAVRIEAKEVLILGTALTMQSSVFRKAFAERGIEAAGPPDKAIRTSTLELIGDLQRGRIENAARRIGGVAKAAFDRRLAGRPVVCLACTELPLAFPNRKTAPAFEFDGVTYINSTAAHIAAAFDLARSSDQKADGSAASGHGTLLRGGHCEVAAREAKL